MKIINLLSIISIFLTVTAVYVSLTRQNANQNDLTNSYQPVSLDSVIVKIPDSIKEQNREHAKGVTSKVVPDFKLDKSQENLIEPKSSFSYETAIRFEKETFWIKVVFSAIFCISALYVILSQKYDTETKKWAFSVLTLIAGVWIGTIS